MAEFPALPLFTDAYLGDTTHLTTFEHGAYLLLLIVSWRTPGCRLPDDDVLLARYARTPLGKWRKLRPILSPFFKISEGHWHQPRLQDEFQLLQSRKTQQSEAGKASAKAKALKRQHRGSTPVASPLQRDGNETPTPTPTPTSVSKDTGAGAPSDDPLKTLFDAGIELLTGTGTPEKQARSQIGKWRKMIGEAETLAAIVAARDANLSQPKEWIEARVNKIMGGRAGDEDEERAISRATAERYRRMGLAGSGPKGER
ncbi:DUF1376 domain-containing protein [Sphingopyxis macrogoltabida]|uniref:DUF1376 domain-containing protein n=1 Tax=Sphingopyxis macrogoltabida TaxID=33050 RepID=A0AAC8Z1S3_SPHMC|nr:DUF1376 domain-containing protein [Sphingopyxis macrogoltabida]ALJ14103.1 hypothetical protein LH19_14610 [Sphingopyxis macrogoltabida]AMU90373.1 hypothetical protein ATM17_15205 [Sphingopyxis macrogoltabida]